MPTRTEGACLLAQRGERRHNVGLPATQVLAMLPIGLVHATPACRPPCHRPPNGGATGLPQDLQGVGNASERRVVQSSFSYCVDAGDADGALRELRRWKHPGWTAYATVINLFANKGDTTKVDALVREAERVGLPILNAFNHRIKARANAGDVAGARALRVAMEASNVVPDRFTFNALIRAHLHVDDLRGAESLVAEMLQPEAPAPPDEKIFSLLLKALGHMGERDRAVGLFEQIGNCGLVANGTHFSATMHACAQAGDVVKTVELLRQAQGLGVADVHHYNIALNACLHADPANVHQGERLLDEMRQSASIAPNAESFGTAMHLYARASFRDKADRVAKALALRREMRERGVEPNGAIDVALFHAYASSGKREEALALLEEKFGGELTPPLVGMMLDGFDDPDLAGRWLDSVWKRAPALRSDLSLWCGWMDVSERAGRDTAPILAAARHAGVIARHVGFRDGKLNFHSRVVGTTRKDGHDTCVSVAMVRALMTYHRDAGNITDTTHYVVGHRGQGRVKQVVLDILREQGRQYAEDPGRRGVLVPVDASPVEARAADIAASDDVPAMSPQVEDAATMRMAPAQVKPRVDWWDASD